MATRGNSKQGLVGALLLLVAVAPISVGSAGATDGISPSSAKQMLTGLLWEPGEAGAELARLWGTADGPSGMLIRAPAGYSTGPVVRTSEYRAFVILGSVMSGDGAAMEKGTFWEQPGGTSHVTTCVSDCLFYVEPEGPWDRLPGGQASSTADGMAVRRITAADMPWVDAPNTGGAVKLAHVWGDPTDAEPSGFFLFFKAGFPGFPHLHTHDYDGVVLQGRPRHWEPNEADVAAATPGSHLWQAGGAAHDDSCDTGEDCITYFRFHGRFDIFPSEAQ